MIREVRRARVEDDPCSNIVHSKEPINITTCVRRGIVNLLRRPYSQFFAEAMMASTQMYTYNSFRIVCYCSTLHKVYIHHASLVSFSPCRHRRSHPAVHCHLVHSVQKHTVVDSATAADSDRCAWEEASGILTCALAVAA